MGAVPWTRLEGTALWEAARAAYAHPPGRTYHGFGHVARLYNHAARTYRLPYDPALDLGVLAHDVLIDPPSAEARSRTWLLEHRDLLEAVCACLDANSEPIDAMLTRAGRFILATEDHRPVPATAAIVLLDLADFLDPEASRANSEALRAEARVLRGTSDEAWTMETVRYLAGLEASLNSDPASEDAVRMELPFPLADQIRAVRGGVRRVADELARRAGHGPVRQP